MTERHDNLRCEIVKGKISDKQAERLKIHTHFKEKFLVNHPTMRRLMVLEMHRYR